MRCYPLTTRITADGFFREDDPVVSFSLLSKCHSYLAPFSIGIDHQTTYRKDDIRCASHSTE